MDIAEVNQQPWLEESGQWLENVYQTHLVLASGKVVLQLNGHFQAGLRVWPLFSRCFALRHVAVGARSASGRWRTSTPTTAHWTSSRRRRTSSESFTRLPRGSFYSYCHKSQSVLIQQNNVYKSSMQKLKLGQAWARARRSYLNHGLVPIRSSCMEMCQNSIWYGLFSVLLQNKIAFKIKQVVAAQWQGAYLVIWRS